MQHHRHTVKATLRVQDYKSLSLMSSDPTLKIMVFCAQEGSGKQDIAFPHQSEIKVNSGDVKANLRGLKNKPGSTRPVDITKDLRLTHPPYANSIEMTYALTSKVAGESQVCYLTPHQHTFSHHFFHVSSYHTYCFIQLLTQSRNFTYCCSLSKLFQWPNW